MQQEARPQAADSSSTARATIAWDTSSRILDVAIKHGDHIEQIQEQAGRRHNELLASAIHTLLGRNNLSAEDLSYVACCRGPGSFTGLRIGIATAKGLVAGVTMSRAGTDRTAVAGPKIVGVPTLMAYAHAVSTPGVVLAAIDGRKNRFYAALYRGDTLLWGPSDATPQAIRNAIGEYAPRSEAVTLVGPDNELLLETLRKATSTPDIPEGSPVSESLRPGTHYEAGVARALIEIAEGDAAERLYLSDGEGPDYLRVSQAEE